MGTLRWEKERAVQAAREKTEAATKQKRFTVAAEEADLELQMKAIQRELEAKRVEKHALTQLDADNTTEQAHGRSHLGELRGVDKR
jgi:translation initiation factor IF-3